MLRSLRAVAGSTENLRGILAMLAAMACFSAGDSLIKYVGRDLPPGEMMFVRGIFTSILTVGFAYSIGALRGLHHALTPAIALRSLGDIGATAFFFVAVLRLPFAEVNAISQSTPLALTAAAALFLAEPVGWRRWSALLVGLLGVLIIIRPGGNAFDWAALFVMASVACVTVRDLLTRHIGLALSASVLASITAVVVTLGGLLLLPFETWRMPSAGNALLLACSGLTIFVGNYAMIMAMRWGEISVVAPFRYTGTIFVVLLGYFVFDEWPDDVTFIGIGVVMVAGLYTLHRETVHMRLRARKS